MKVDLINKTVIKEYPNVSDTSLNRARKLIARGYKELDDSLIKKLIAILFNRESYAGQYLAFLLGSLVVKETKLSIDKIGIVSIGMKLIESFRRTKLISCEVGFTENNEATLKVTPKVFYSTIDEGKQLVPYAEPVSIESYNNKKALCHKEFWTSSKIDLMDSIEILNSVKFKVDNNITVDLSFEESNSKHLEIDRNKKFIDQYDNNQEFTFAHFIDMRGRLYSRGYYLNPQGTKWKKAKLTMLNETEVKQAHINGLKDLINGIKVEPVKAEPKVNSLQEVKKAEPVKPVKVSNNISYDEDGYPVDNSVNNSKLTELFKIN